MNGSYEKTAVGAEFESISRFEYNQQRMYNAPSRLTGRKRSTILKSVNFTPQIFDSLLFPVRVPMETRYANEGWKRKEVKQKQKKKEKRGEKEKKRSGKKGRWEKKIDRGSFKVSHGNRSSIFRSAEN